jgi:ubiquinone/menaquinone biosynthesis C-methylase UbiE
MAFVSDPADEESRALHRLVDFAARRVLEIGCGDGRLTWRYADRAAAVLALDPKPAEIDRALARRPDPLRERVTFRVADVTAEELPASAFDVGLFARSL